MTTTGSDEAPRKTIKNYRTWLNIAVLDQVLQMAQHAVRAPAGSISQWESVVVGAMAKALLDSGTFGRKPQPVEASRVITPPYPIQEVEILDIDTGEHTPLPPKNRNRTCCVCHYWRITHTEVDEKRLARGLPNHETIFGVCLFHPPMDEEGSRPFVHEDGTCSQFEPGDE